MAGNRRVAHDIFGRCTKLLALTSYSALRRFAVFRHNVLKNLRAIDNSGRGILYYSCILFNLGAGVFGLFGASYGWRIRDGMSRKGVAS